MFVASKVYGKEEFGVYDAMNPEVKVSLDGRSVMEGSWVILTTKDFEVAQEYALLKEFQRMGLLLRAPVAPGATVYIADFKNAKVWPQKVTRVVFVADSQNRNYIETFYSNFSNTKVFRKWSFAQMGKKWFLTEDAAWKEINNRPFEQLPIKDEGDN